MSDLARNDDAYHRYSILEDYDAGIVLTGAETKSAKLKRISLRGSYVTMLGSEAFLTGATISRYPKSDPALPYDPERRRKLLLKKSELTGLIGKVGSAGLTLVPLRMYQKGGLIKLVIGLARGKKKYDRRQEIKKREVTRDVQRALRRRA